MAGTFGPYLVGVPLVPNFIATVSNDTTQSVTGVTYSIDSGTPVKANSQGNHKWSIPLDVGSLSNAPHTLTVATVGSGSPVKMSYTLKMQNSLNFDTLTTSYPGNPGGPVDATSLRYISGITLTDGSGNTPPQFTGDVRDMPWYYATTTSFPDVQIDPGKVQVAIASFQATKGAIGATFTFSYDGGNLQPGKDSVALLTTTTSGGVGTRPTFSTQTLNAIPLPGWMGKPTRAVFTTDPEISSALQGATAGYAIDLRYGLATQTVPLPLTENTPDFLGSLFNDFSGSFGTGITLTVYATLEPTQATIKPKNWYAQATILGNPVIQQGGQIPTSKGGVSVQVNLDPETLAAPTKIEITATKVNLLPSPNNVPVTFFQLPFSGSHTFSVPVPNPILQFFGVTLNATLSVDGGFQASLDSLTASANFVIDINNGSPSFDPKALSYFQINATGHAALTLNAKGSVGVGSKFFSLLGLPSEVTLISAAASGTVSANVNAALQVDLAGPLTSPTFKFDSSQSYASALVSYAISFHGPPEPKDEDAKLINIFGNPPPPSLGNPAGVKADGPGSTGNPGYSGASPSNGSSFSQLGPATGGGPSATSDVVPSLVGAAAVKAASAPLVPPPPTSTLTVLQPIAAPLGSLSFDLNVLADHATLTPGHHFLDVVLADPSGNQVSLEHIDLATIALAANDNPLGYASGWTTITASPAAGALDEGTPYQLEFLLTNDLAGTGQSVAVALDNLGVNQFNPQLGISDSASGGARADRSSSGPAP